MSAGAIRPGVFSAMEVAASGMSAERSRMNIVAGNLANARTTRTAEGGPYKRLDPVFQAKSLAPRAFDPILRRVETVEVAEVRADPTPGMMVYEPGHPDANEAGYVRYPDIDTTQELVKLMDAKRIYEANAAVFSTAKSMLRAALDI